MGGYTVGEAIDAALEDESTEFVFTVVASKDRVRAVYVVSKQDDIPLEALDHVDKLREAVADSILRSMSTFRDCLNDEA